MDADIVQAAVVIALCVHKTAARQRLRSSGRVPLDGGKKFTAHQAGICISSA